nr:protein C04H5.5 [imported] - Caenorhabditis elegans [Caenorhabditis elegans]
MRPTIRRVRLATEIALKTKGNLVDSMMRMMEEYANNLEKLVGERTKLAEEANLRAERLLFQLLPNKYFNFQPVSKLFSIRFKFYFSETLKHVAIELKAGRTVAPKMYDSATVMFSDIVGFTKLCSASTPIEVVNLLNKLYSEFDTVISKHDCYKVETIGDAYMVVSGIPIENGQRHVANISAVTLGIMDLLKVFEVPHRRDYRLTIRLGFASGQVSAAVVGLSSPRYCLFGETVNIAAVMESSGEGGRVQITETSKILLENEYPEFIIEIRGINKDVFCGKIPSSHCLNDFFLCKPGFLICALLLPHFVKKYIVIMNQTFSTSNIPLTLVFCFLNMNPFEAVYNLAVAKPIGQIEYKSKVITVGNCYQSVMDTSLTASHFGNGRQSFGYKVQWTFDWNALQTNGMDGFSGVIIITPQQQQQLEFDPFDSTDNSETTVLHIMIRPPQILV